jgi:hypothetical protein
MLDAIAKALLQPNEWVYFHDHVGYLTPRAAYDFAYRIRRIGVNIGITLKVDADVGHQPCVRIMSPVDEMQAAAAEAG